MINKEIMEKHFFAFLNFSAALNAITITIEVPQSSPLNLHDI